MKSTSSRLTVWAVMCGFLLATSGCGFVLYPERRTEPLSTEKDTAVIVYDCLWLLAGIIPGVVALAVDGANDTWYYTESEFSARQANGRARTTAPRGDEVSIRLHGPAPADAVVTLQLSDDEGRVLATTTTTCDPAADRQMVSIRVPQGVDASEATLVLAVNGSTQLTWDLTIVD